MSAIITLLGILNFVLSIINAKSIVNFFNFYKVIKIAYKILSE